MFENLLSVLSIYALRTGYDSPRMMTSNLGLQTMWILGISTSYVDINWGCSHLSEQKWDFLAPYDVDIPNIHVVFRPKFEVIIRGESYRGCRAFLKGPITPFQTYSDYATFISNLASLQLDFHSETESQRRVPNVRYLFLISNPVDYFEFYFYK